MRPMSPKTKPSEKKSVIRDLADGFRYIRKARNLLALELIAALANLLAFPCTYTILPVFARDVLKIGAPGLGWLNAARGLGGFIGSTGVAMLSNFKRKGWLLVILSLFWGCMLIAFAFSP